MIEPGVLLSFWAIVSLRSASDRQRPPFPQRRSGRWGAIVIVAALLNLATATTSAAQDTGTGAAVPGPVSGSPDQPSQPASARPFLDSVQIDLGYTYDDNVTLGRA